MSEQQFHVVALSPLRNAFFDPESRINLSRTSPQGYIPVGSPISGSIRAGLLGGGLIDVNMTLLPDIIKARDEAAKQKKAGFPRPAVSAGSANEPVVKVEVPVTEAKVEVPAEEPKVEAPVTEIPVEDPKVETPVEVEVKTEPAPAGHKSKAKAK